MLSHLAAADDPAFESFTLQQIADFKKACLMFRERTGKKPLRHILNSAGIERYPEAAMDMVRLGIGLYGHSLLSPAKMMCVSEFKTRIMQVKELKKGQTAGYSRAGKAKTDMRIATIPVGYADGLPRSAGKGRVSLRVKGKTVPTFGNICMDMSMVDITGTGAREGDEVCIFGKDQPVAQLARQLGTIPYELFAGISERVKRVYYHE
jgi:alanine racemase